MNNSYTFTNSILNDSVNSLDFYAPVTFLLWLKQKNTVSSDIQELFLEYKKYVIEWGKKKKQDKITTKQTIRDSYVQLLRELVVNFSTEEEKRFIVNADFTSSSDLDIVLPFFIQKIKQVCLYYANLREEPKTASIQHNLRGSNKGIENLIKRIIFDAAQIDAINYTAIPCNFPPLSALVRDVSVSVEELYDLEDSYFNISPSTKFTPVTSFRASLSSTNINIINSDLYLDLRQAITEAILQYPFFINSLGTSNFNINPVLSGTELQYLKSRDFINYVSGGPLDLKLSLLKKLAPKFLGNDFYYLSTGSTATSYVSGILFSVKSLSGAATLNFLNKHYPSTATVPNLDTLYTEYEIGRFFLPQHQGILIHNTPSKIYSLDSTKLLPNTLYTFPDPNISGNTSFNSDDANEYSPLLYTVDVSWNKKSRSEQYAFGDVLSNSYNPLYYGYESREQDTQQNIAGVCKTYDNLEFWTGLRQEKWDQRSVWPVLDQYPIDERQQSIAANDLTPVYWGNDIYGNEYGLLKKVNYFKTVSGLNNDKSILQNSKSILSPSYDTPKIGIYDKKVSIPGHLYFRNNFTDTVLPGSAALSAVFFKYPSPIKAELQSSLHYFAIYYDTFVAETANYVIVDSIEFNLKSNSVLINSNPGTYFKKWKLDNKLEKFAGEWYSEYDKQLYLCFLTLNPYLSGSNYRRLHPVIYRTPLKTVKLEKIYPDPTLNLEQVYSLSGGFNDPPQIDLFKIDGISFSRLEKTNLFNLTYLAKNLNGIPFFVNEQIQKSDPYFDSYTPELFKPFYFTYDNNYSNPYLPFFVKYAASSSGVMGTHSSKGLVFETGREEFNKDGIYLYTDGIKPAQINHTGRFFVQFDWESYQDVGVFIGCDYYKVKRIGNNLLWKANTPSPILLDEYNEEIIATTVPLFSSYTFGTSGLDTTIMLNQGYLAKPATVGDKSLTIILTWTDSLTGKRPSEPEEWGRIPNEPRVLPPYASFACKFGDVLSGTPTYFIDSYTNGTTAVVTLCASTVPLTGGWQGLERDFDQGTAIRFYNWWETLVDLTYTSPAGKLTAKVKRPVYPDPSILEFNVTTDVPGMTSLICDAPESIYKNILITKAGPGDGIIISDPFCINCGDKCSEVFSVGTELAFSASATFYSVFDHWEGSYCQSFGNSDCIFVVTSSANLTAYFAKAPTWTIYVTTPVSKVVNQDYSINVTGPAINVPYILKANTVQTLSVQVPVSGWEYRKFSRGPCAGFEQPWYQPDWQCSFQLKGDTYFEPRFVRYFDYQVTTAAIPVSTVVWSPGEIGTIYSMPLTGGGIGNKGGAIVCPYTCYTTFTGTGSILSGGYNVVLSAVTPRGYRLVKWIGSPCEDTAETAGITVPYPGKTEATNPCSFVITNDVSVSGYFDVGYYTLTILISGDGIGKIYSLEEPINYENNVVGSVSKYNILSGTNITVRASAYNENAILGLSSRFCEPVFGLDYCDMRMDNDQTIIATLSVGKYYVLYVNKENCGVRVISMPDGLIGGLNCGGTVGAACSAVYGAGTLVSLTQANSSTSCFIKAFTGPGVFYRYSAGDGIIITQTVTQMITGDTFGLIDNSIILDPNGAPFYGGQGITVSDANAYIIMSEMRSVSAIVN